MGLISGLLAGVVRCRDCLYRLPCVSKKSDSEVLIYSSPAFQVSSVSMHEVVQQPFVKLMGKGKEHRLQLHALSRAPWSKSPARSCFPCAHQENTSSSLHAMMLLPSCAAGQTEGSTSPPRPACELTQHGSAPPHTQGEHVETQPLVAGS